MLLDAYRRGLRLFLLVGTAMGLFAAAAQAQDILIVRPLENNKTEVTARNIVFEVEVSSFDPVVRVTINGENQPIDPGPTVLVRKRVQLNPGVNKFVVQVNTEFDQASKEFQVRYRGRPKPVAAKKEKKAPFQLIGVIGSQNSSNALKVPADVEETAARRNFLILIPRYDFSLAKDSSLRLQSIISRDFQNKKELESEEIAFTQFTAAWIIETSKRNSWSAGLGYNLIYQKLDSVLNGENRKEYDTFLFGSMRRGFGSKSFYDLSLELKTQELTAPVCAEGESAADTGCVDADSNEDAQVTTLNASMEGPLLGFKGKLKGGYATVAADGKLKSKDVMRLAATLHRPIGPVILGLGVKSRRNTFKEPNPAFDDVAPTETLTSYVLNGTLPLSRSWILTAEYENESQSSNIATSEYENTSLSTSVIFIF